MRLISIPKKALDALRRSKGVEFVANDGQITSQSQSAKKTVKLPNPGSSNHVVPRSDISVAVLDSGISYHNDLNVLSQINCVVNTAPCSDYSHTQGTSGQTYMDSFNASIFFPSFVRRFLFSK